MGMSTYVKGFRPPDDLYRKMRAVYDSCVAANILVPEDVDRFFNWEPPNDHGVEVDIRAAVTEYHNDAQEGLDVDVTKLPKDVTVIRFINSW